MPPFPPAAVFGAATTVDSGGRERRERRKKDCSVILILNKESGGGRGKEEVEEELRELFLTRYVVENSRLKILEKFISTTVLSILTHGAAAALYILPSFENSYCRSFFPHKIENLFKVTPAVASASFGLLRSFWVGCFGGVDFGCQLGGI